MLHAAVRSTPCWSGGSTDGVDRWPTWSPRSRNSANSMSVSRLSPKRSTMTTASGRPMAGLLAVFAQFENDLLRERVRSGMAEAKLKGKRLSRPPTMGLHAAPVLKLFRAGVSKAEIALRLNLARTSVRRLLAADSRAK